MDSYEWIWPKEQQQDVNDELEKLKIFESPQAPLYHYTSREIFWKIMEEESFLARHILFSNDFGENMIGKQAMEKAVKNEGSALAESDALPFMICFCKKEDLLSQWRGYANEGVTIEFDFSKGLYGRKEGFSSYHCYTLVNKDINSDKDKDEDKDKNKDKDKDKRYWSSSLGKDKLLFNGAIISPYAVNYITGSEIPDQVIQNKVSNIMQAPSIDNRQQYFIKMIPYIKNEKFDEEQEYRLIFDMRQLVSGNVHLLEQMYVYLDVDGVKKPNIRVKFGNQYEAEQEGPITIYYHDNSLTKELKSFREDLKREKVEVELVRKVRKYKMKPNELILTEGKNQKQVCIRLRQRLNQKSVKIWCDGHMPIRRIIVGPSKDAAFMKSSIEEYIKTKYWMNDIVVDISKIPLRT